ncbi:mutator type transposase, partial [Tanacetum coccineum]
SDDLECERKRALKKLAKAHRPVDGQMYSEKFYVGQSLANKQLIKEMVSKLSVAHMQRKYELGMFDSIKCPWLLHCSKSKKAETWWVKKFNDSHTCLQSRSIGKCTASFLSKEIEETIKPNPRVPISALKDQLQRKYELGMSDMKIFRAKQMAEERVIGDWVKQYAQLRQYALELKEKNPETTIKIDVERCFDVESETRQFRRIYICLGALKNGFKAGKRDLLGLDGCFLSGPYPGQILTAVGVDPNNRIYPLAYAVVESEIKESWLWFLDCLGDDLELFRNSNFTFISDRQKGKLSRAGKTVTCLKCGQQGHNKRSCKGQRQKGSASGSHAPPQAPSQTTTHASAQAPQSSTQPSQSSNRFTKSTANKLSPLKKKFVSPRHAATQKNGVPKPTATTKKNDVSKAKDLSISCIWLTDNYLCYVLWMFFNVIKRDAASIRSYGIEETCMIQQVHMETNVKSLGNHWHALFKINPCNGPDMWSESDTPITLTPPNYKPLVDRPRKKRRKSAAEIYDNLVKKGKLSRAGKTVTCLNSIFFNPTSQAPQSSTQPSQASQSSNRFTKSTANRLSPLKKKFVGPRPAATQKNGVPKPTAATKKKDVSKAKGKQKKN